MTRVLGQDHVHIFHQGPVSAILPPPLFLLAEDTTATSAVSWAALRGLTHTVKRRIWLLPAWPRFSGFTSSDHSSACRNISFPVRSHWAFTAWFDNSGASPVHRTKASTSGTALYVRLNFCQNHGQALKAVDSPGHGVKIDLIPALHVSSAPHWEPPDRNQTGARNRLCFESMVSMANRLNRRRSDIPSLLPVSL